MTVGALGLDPAAVEVYLYGERIVLPLREFQLLHLLMKNAGRVLTRQQINQLIWSHSEEPPTPSTCTSAGYATGSVATCATRAS